MTKHALIIVAVFLSYRPSSGPIYDASGLFARELSFEMSRLGALAATTKGL